jgi:hypothetical protein
MRIPGDPVVEIGPTGRGPSEYREQAVCRAAEIPEADRGAPGFERFGKGEGAGEDGDGRNIAGGLLKGIPGN